VSRLHRWNLVSLIEPIASGEVEEGALLPSEEELAMRFNVGRGVTREALRALEEALECCMIVEGEAAGLGGRAC
jgi:DNA-binding FadR family transcriptional regulator